MAPKTTHGKHSRCHSLRWHYPGQVQRVSSQPDWHPLRLRVFFLLQSLSEIKPISSRGGRLPDDFQAFHRLQGLITGHERPTVMKGGGRNDAVRRIMMRKKGVDGRNLRYLRRKAIFFTVEPIAKRFVMPECSYRASMISGSYKTGFPPGSVAGMTKLGVMQLARHIIKWISSGDDLRRKAFMFSP
jgi:hypothetical protein